MIDSSWKFLKLFLCATFMTGGLVKPSILVAQSNPIVVENQNAGTTSWRLSKPANDTGLQMKAYLSQMSAAAGEAVDVFASVSPAQNYKLEVYRMGYYGGDGGRLMRTFSSIAGSTQSFCPVDASTGQITCDWTSDLSLIIPSDWTTGIYLFKFTNSQGFEYHFPFAVRDDSRTPDIIYQQPVTTYHAYNIFPDDGVNGKSTYTSRSYGANTISGTSRAVKVSFDRPYHGDGSRPYLILEHATIQFIEEHGYDVGYVTNIDVHRNPALLLEPKAIISGGHDEYWTSEIYDAFGAARDSGVNLLFIGANAAFWQIRFEPSEQLLADRVLVVYKSSSIDPEPIFARKTVTFRAIGKAEQQLVGVQYITYGQAGSQRDFIAQNTDHWIFEGTGLIDGSSVAGIIGGEVDILFSQYPQPVATEYTVLGSSPFRGVLSEDVLAQTVIYKAPSGAWVFASASLRWQSAMAGNESHPAIRQMMKNLLDQYVEGGADEGLTLSKLASLNLAGDFPTVGDTVTYRVDLLNSGDLVFGNLTVDDPLPGLGTMDCGNGTASIAALVPNESVSCIAEYSITQGDLNSGAIENTASVSGSSAKGSFVIESNAVMTPLPAALSIVQTGVYEGGAGSSPMVGEVVSYTYSVSNTSNTPMEDLLVSNSLQGMALVDCGASDNDLDGDIDWLEAGQSASCVATYNITQTDIDANSVVNTASVSDGVYTAFSEELITLLPNLVSAVACGAPTIDASSEAGLFIWQDCLADQLWHMVATAGGSESVATYQGRITSNLTVTDLSTSSFESSDIARIENGNSIEFLLRMLKSGVDGIEFSANLATSLCLSLDANSIANPVYLGAAKLEYYATELDLLTGLGCDEQPFSSMSMTASGVFDSGSDSESSPGDIISYQFVVTNDGTRTLADIVVTDSLAGTSVIDCGTFDTDGDSDIDVLMPASSAICSVSYAITQQDIDTGLVLNTATANSGNATAQSQTVSTSIAGQFTHISCGTPSIDSSTEAGVFIWQDCLTNGSWHVITTAGGSSSVASYEGILRSNALVSDLTTVSYESSDELSTSDSNTILFLMRMLNSGQDGIDFNSAGGTALCLTLSQNSAGNAVYLGENKAQVSADGEIDLFTGLSCGSAPTPAMVLFKTGIPQWGGTDDPQPGDIIVYEFRITNTGNTQLQDIVLTDLLPGIGQVDCSAGDLDADGDVDTLDIGEHVTCDATYAISQTNIDDGHVLNNASASDGNVTATSGNVITEISGQTENLSSCGVPDFDSAVEKAAFVWQDCPAGVPSGDWHMRLTAGGGGVVRYDGVLSADTSLSSITPFSFENSDSLSGTPQQQDFLMRMLGNGVDGLDFHLDGGTQLCLEFVAASANSAIFLGQDRIMSTGPTNLLNDQACN